MGRPILVLVLAIFAAGAGWAQHPQITGTWQGSVTNGKSEVRVAVNIAKNRNGGFKGTLFRLDQQGTAGIRLTNIMLKDSQLSFKATDAVDGLYSYEGQIAPEGALINGMFWWKGQPMKLDLKRTSKPQHEKP